MQTWIPVAQSFPGLGIYKRKEESMKTRKHALVQDKKERTPSRKHALDQESVHEKKNSFKKKIFGKENAFNKEKAQDKKEKYINQFLLSKTL